MPVHGAYSTLNQNLQFELFQVKLPLQYMYINRERSCATNFDTQNENLEIGEVYKLKVVQVDFSRFFLNERQTYFCGVLEF